MNKTHTSNLIFPEVKIVEASAGSGKTYELAKRFMQLLMNPRLKENQKYPGDYLHSQSNP